MLARDGIFAAKFRGCTLRATEMTGVGLKPDLQRAFKRMIGVGGVLENFFASGAKFIRLPLDNACDQSPGKNFQKFSAAHRYPQKRWKTSG